MKPAYYNEHDGFAAQWIRNLIAEKLIPEGEVDDRSIVEVEPRDLHGFGQCHFFAGIGGWALAARLAGWPDDRELWTGSAPCQPFSVAGKGHAQADDRHLWPHLFRLAGACRPPVLMGEQVAAAVGKDWLDGVFVDLESIGYACGAVIVPACAVDAPHRRDRLWFVAHADGEPRGQGGSVDGGLDAGSASESRAGPWGRSSGRAMGNTERAGLEGLGGHVDDRNRSRRIDALESGSASETGSGDGALADARSRGVRDCGRPQSPRAEEALRGEIREQRFRTDAGADGGGRSAWSGADWIVGHDGKARRVEPSIRLLAHGVPGRVGRLRAYGNAIVPQEAAEVIGAYLDTLGSAS